MKNQLMKFGKWSLISGIATFIGCYVPPGLDWRLFFNRQETFPTFYPPWISAVIPLIPWPLLFSISVTAIIWGITQKGGKGLQIVTALLTLPFWMWLFLGSLDCIVLLGVLTLPFGIPIVLAKLPIAGFALLAKKNWIVVSVALTVILFFITGWWPGEIFAPEANLPPQVQIGSYPNRWLNYSLFPFSLLIAIPLLYWSRGDVDLLMAAGALATPYVVMYHYVVLLPAIGRMHKWLAIACVPLSWLPYFLRAVAPQTWAWALCNLFPLLIWSGVYFEKVKKADWKHAFTSSSKAGIS